MSDGTAYSQIVTGYDSSGWWRIKPGEPCHIKLSAHGKFLRNILRRVHHYDRILEKIYETPRIRMYTEAVERLRGFGLTAARLNVAKSITDSFVARIGKKRAMPAFAIDDADWSLKRQAKQYRKWLVGKMSETEFDRLSPLALRDSAIVRAGLTKIVDAEDDVVAERVYANEWLVDPREAQYGRPWQAIQVHRVARDWLIDRYPDKADVIKMASHSVRQEWEFVDDEDIGRAMDLSGYVDVWEGWRLPTDIDADDNDYDCDGRHALVVDTGTLLSEEWDRPRFPVAVMRYDHSLRGWWGKSLVMQLAEIQHRINQIVRDIQANLEVGGKLIVAVNEQFDIPVETLTGAAPYKLKFRGPQAPQFNVPNAVNMAHVEMLKYFIQLASDLTGVGQAFATSRSSLGLNASGVALDTQYDIESERFSHQEMNYANYRLDSAQLYIDAAQSIAKRRESQKGKKRSSVLVTGYTTGQRMEKLDFAKVALEPGKYKLQLEPVNFIPDTRAGKLSAVQELTKAGVLPQWMAGALFDEPDISRANAVAFADYHNLERIMEVLADDDADLGEVMPEAYHDLKLALIMGRAYYNRAQAEGAPEAVQARYRMWIESVKDLQKKQADLEQQAAAPPGGPGAPAPGGPPPGPNGMVPSPNGPPVPGVPAVPPVPMNPPVAA